MTERSRGLRETVVRALAKVGLVWAVAVLGALFMATSAQGQRDGSDVAAASASAETLQTPFSIPAGDPPRTAGLALALVLLAGGVTVLAVGASRERGAGSVLDDPDVQLRYSDEPHPGSDLPLALGLSLLA